MSRTRSLFSRVAVACVVATFSAVALAGGPPRSYRFVDFAVPDAGPLGTSIFGINDSGTLVGNYDDGSGNIAAFYSRKGAVATVIVEESLYNTLYDVNSHGVAVGDFINDEGVIQGFVYYPDGTIHLLPSPVPGADFSTSAINNRGDIVGFYTLDFFTTAQGFLYRDGMYTFFAPPGSFITVPWRITNNGVIVGSYIDQEGNEPGFILDRKGRYTPFNAPVENLVWTTIYGINEGGDIVGLYFDGETRRSYVFAKGVFRTLEFPGSDDTVTFDIANNGTIVGTYNSYSGGFIAYPTR